MSPCSKKKRQHSYPNNKQTRRSVNIKRNKLHINVTQDFDVKIYKLYCSLVMPIIIKTNKNEKTDIKYIIDDVIYTHT